MAQTQTDASRPIHPVRLGIEACKTDDVPLMAHVISIASSPESRNTVQEVIQKGLNRSVARAAIRVLTYLLDDQGADVNTISSREILRREQELGGISREVLEILIAHGWDINTRGPNGTDLPLLWCVTLYPDLVAWCLAHGASVDLPSITPQGASVDRPGVVPPLLEAAAAGGTVATFELLRARGALLGRRTLHKAVMRVPMYAPSDDPVRTAYFEERMDMVRHLVDVVGLDVNAEALSPRMFWRTPLCYLASRYDGKTAKELVWFLLDRGADPYRIGPSDGHITAPSAVEYALSNPLSAPFLDAVEEWEARQHDNATA